MDKPTPAKELEKLREQHDIAVDHLKYVEQWARYHDHGIRVKTIEALKKLGAWNE